MEERKNNQKLTVPFVKSIIFQIGEIEHTGMSIVYLFLSWLTVPSSVISHRGHSECYIFPFFLFFQILAILLKTSMNQNNCIHITMKLLLKLILCLTILFLVSPFKAFFSVCFFIFLMKCSFLDFFRMAMHLL